MPDEERGEDRLVADRRIIGNLTLVAIRGLSFESTPMGNMRNMSVPTGADMLTFIFVTRLTLRYADRIGKQVRRLCLRIHPSKNETPWLLYATLNPTSLSEPLTAWFFFPELN